MINENEIILQIEKLIKQLQERYPCITVQRLEESPRSCGDNFVWYFTQPSCPYTIQVDPEYNGLFLIATDEYPGYYSSTSIEDSADKICNMLHLSPDMLSRQNLDMSSTGIAGISVQELFHKTESGNEGEKDAETEDH